MTDSHFTARRIGTPSPEGLAAPEALSTWADRYPNAIETKFAEDLMRVIANHYNVVISDVTQAHIIAAEELLCAVRYEMRFGQEVPR